MDIFRSKETKIEQTIAKIRERVVIKDPKIYNIGVSEIEWNKREPDIRNILQDASLFTDQLVEDILNHSVGSKITNIDTGETHMSTYGRGTSEDIALLRSNIRSILEKYMF